MEKQYQNRTWLRDKYVLEKLPTTEIGKLCGDSSKETIWNINNGITLCEECHKEIHKMLRINKY